MLFGYAFVGTEVLGVVKRLFLRLRAVFGVRLGFFIVLSRGWLLSSVFQSILLNGLVNDLLPLRYDLFLPQEVFILADPFPVISHLPVVGVFIF
jgi:hypothetical protein